MVKYTPLTKTGGTLGYDAYVSLRLANGMVGCLQYSGSVNQATAKSRLEIVGDSTCTLEAEDNDRVTLLGESPERTVWNVKETGAKLWGHQQQNEYFVRCILDGRTPSVTPQDGRKAMEIALRIARSASPG